MKLYMIYAKMNETELYDMNQYGQYDNFNDGIRYEEDPESRIVLWGYTKHPEIRDQFYEERPIHGRFLERKLNLSKEEYEDFRDGHHRYELLPIPLSIKPSGSWNETFEGRLQRDKKFKPTEGNPERYRYRIITQYEYDFITTNYAEIVGMMFTNLFRNYEFPIDLSIFSKKYQKLLDEVGYTDTALTFHPEAIRFMNDTPDVYERFKAHFPFDYLGKYQTSELNLWYLTFENVIDRESVTL